MSYKYYQSYELSIVLEVVHNDRYSETMACLVYKNMEILVNIVIIIMVIVIILTLVG